MTEVIELNTTAKTLRKHYPEISIAVPSTSRQSEPNGRVQAAYMFAGDVLGVEAIWGFAPCWSGFISQPRQYVGVEDIERKPAVKKAFRSRRCIIPANSFTYVRKENDTSMRYTLRPLGDELLLIGGICELNGSLASASRLPTVAVITTPPNSMMESHARQVPLFLPKEEVMAWLRPGTDIKAVKQLIRPAKYEALSLNISVHPVERITSSLSWVAADLQLV